MARHLWMAFRFVIAAVLLERRLLGDGFVCSILGMLSLSNRTSDDLAQGLYPGSVLPATGDRDTPTFSGSQESWTLGGCKSTRQEKRSLISYPWSWRKLCDC